MQKVSCIICVYNEAIRISNVLKVVTNHSLIDEVIVVDDGSQDTTINEIRKFKGIHLLRHKKNLGKTRSMFDGCNEARNEIVMFLDGDLIGLTHEDLTQLIKPPLHGLVDMTMAMCKYNRIINVLLNLIGHEFLSGERVIKRELAKKILENVSGYCAEVKMNQYILDHKLKFLVVKWPNVRAITKKEKVGLGKAILYTFMGFNQLACNLSLLQIFKQMLFMGKLSAKYQKELVNRF